ncbi:arylsulfatase [Blastopirellula marina]|uniref:Arylsulfatase n=1 Tax=Blastopirellula marina TaxID=124 RepID=A0A2S8G3M9_9BACT|nr:MULTISPECIES: sulfatase-like hydrolase/transferase [Pirellulaceae]PQO38754.1 arylsulfatase [Blastopirellula marina]RCS55062.1 arylsulfatase [Bremerella cremea]
MSLFATWGTSVKHLIIAAVVFLSFTGALRAAELPNVVILYADDMGFGDLGANNPDSKIPTPNLDRLAREGLRLTDGHSSSGICTPSRYALLTGRYHWRKFHGIVQAFGPPVLDKEELTLPEILKEKGYKTACIGKWHLGWNWEDILRPDADIKANRGNRVIQPEAFDWSQPISGGPTSHGFDEYFGDDVPNFPPYAWFKNDRVVGEPSVMLTETPKTPEGSWSARPGPAVKDWDFWAVVPALADKAVDWIASQKGKPEPFFLYVPFNSPHSPIVPTEEFVGSSQAGPFGDFVHMTDAMAGKILAALKENGFEDNTLVIFTADNGAENYAYERVKNFGHWSSAPFRGVKRDLYEGGHHVPFIVKWPGKIKLGSTSDALTSQVDLMGTIAAIVDYQLPKDTAHDSYNQLAAWTSNEASPRNTIVHNTAAKAYAIRDGKWLLVDAKSGSQNRIPEWFDQQRGYQKDNLPGELYNLESDPAQKKNLYESKPELVQQLKQKLKTIQANGQVR